MAADSFASFLYIVENGGGQTVFPQQLFRSIPWEKKREKRKVNLVNVNDKEYLLFFKYNGKIKYKNRMNGK